jgi:hypothetical protein
MMTTTGLFQTMSGKSIPISVENLQAAGILLEQDDGSRAAVGVIKALWSYRAEDRDGKKKELMGGRKVPAMHDMIRMVAINEQKRQKKCQISLNDYLLNN